MSDNKAAAEPSMEDILASIRRILSEDEAEEQAKAEEPAPAPEPEPEPEPELEPEPMPMPEPEPEPEPVFEPEPMVMAEPEPVEDVLELTDDMLVEDEIKPMFSMEDMEAIGAELEQDEPPPPPPPPPQPRRAAPIPPDDEPLMSDFAQDRASSALAQLARSVARDRAILLGNGGLTLEEMVREILKPILKDWLDENLPYMIERIVKNEIEKMVNRVETFE